MLGELILINSSKAGRPGRAANFLPRAAYAQKVKEQNIILRESLQWVMAQALVTSAAGLLTQKKIKFSLLQENTNGHFLSYLKLLPEENGKHKVNQLAAKVAQTYADIQFVYHPYHLINQRIDAAYEISRHQIYLGHQQIINFTLKDHDLLHELRHAKRNILAAAQIPSIFYGHSISIFPEMMNYSIYNRQLMHDEPLVYFSEIKSLIYAWKRAWQHGKWRSQKLLRQKIALYTEQAMAICLRLQSIAHAWHNAMLRGEAKIEFYYAANNLQATLKLTKDGHTEQTYLPLIRPGHLKNAAPEVILYRRLRDLARGGGHFIKVFRDIRDFFGHLDEQTFDEEEFAKLEQVLQGHHPS